MERVIILIALTMLSGVCPSEDLNQDIPEEKVSPGRVKGTRNYLGYQFLSLSERIDHFFAGSAHNVEENKSHLVLYTSNTLQEAGNSEEDVRLKARVDLPNTQRRLRLFIETDPNEDNSLEDRTRPVSKGDEIERDTSVVGVEFAKPRPARHWKTSFSLGARFKSGIKPLTRLRFRRYWELGEKWQGYFRQDFWYLGATGPGETSYLEFTRLLSDKSHFQWHAELEYRDEDEPLSYVNSYRVSRQLSARWEWVSTAGLVGQGTADKMQDNRFINTSLKYQLYQDWVFIDLTPELFFSEERNYKNDYSITATLKIWLTD